MKSSTLLTLGITILPFVTARGQNNSAAKFNLPLIQTKYTADPAPYVHGQNMSSNATASGICIALFTAMA